jgi:hypothetical protein
LAREEEEYRRPASGRLLLLLLLMMTRVVKMRQPATATLELKQPRRTALLQGPRNALRLCGQRSDSLGVGVGAWVA